MPSEEVVAHEATTLSWPDPYPGAATKGGRVCKPCNTYLDIKH
jgi:hypothetical protein